MHANSADVTIKDVASLAGVSPMTVSRVINESNRVSPETQRRVEKAIAELGRRPTDTSTFSKTPSFGASAPSNVALMPPLVSSTFATFVLNFSFR